MPDVIVASVRLSQAAASSCVRIPLTGALLYASRPSDLVKQSAEAPKHGGSVVNIALENDCLS